MFIFTILRKTITSRTLLTLLVVGSVGLEAAAQRLSSVMTALRTPEASVPAIPVGGNPNCSDLNLNNAQFPNITTDFEFKIDSPFSHGGPWPFQSSGNRILVGPTDLSNTITTTGTGTVVNFTSTKAISAVIVKGAGQTANVYYYANGSFGDNDLVVIDGSISHVTFCYFQPASVTIIKEVFTNPFGTSSTFAFDFSASGLNVPNFSLVDQDVIGPDRFIQTEVYTFAPSTISVTEAVAPPATNWTLSGVSCTESAGGGLPNVEDTMTDFPAGRSALISLQQGESVVCVFTNSQLAPSAAPAAISGRAVDAIGNGISGARVVLSDAATGVSFIATTSPFGYYHIEGPEVGNFYVLSISHKRYTFLNDTRMFTLNEDLAGVDFTALP